jgi:DNA-binding FadR family transcriptional regulator
VVSRRTRTGPAERARGQAVASERSAPVSSVTLSEQVSRQIVMSVLRGDLATGSLLPPEKELARRFDVSRPVVREAVKAVAMLGLVHRRQGRGTRIAPRDEWRQLAPELLMARTELGAVEDVLLELLELRRMVEVEAAALAARRASDEDIAEMRQHLEAMEARLDDPDAFTRSDLAFHQAVLSATGNTLLPPLFEQLRPLLAFARRFSAATRLDGPSRSQGGHRAIFEAIRDRDAEGARRAMMDHLSWTANVDFAERERRLERQDATRGRVRGTQNSARER